jgi:hypothetical protein
MWVGGNKPLASGAVAGTLFSGLGGAFAGAGLNLTKMSAGKQEDDNAFAQIKVSGTIKVPGLPGYTPPKPPTYTPKPSTPPPTNANTSVTPTWDTAKDKPPPAPTAGGGWGPGQHAS